MEETRQGSGENDRRADGPDRTGFVLDLPWPRRLIDRRESGSPPLPLLSRLTRVSRVPSPPVDRCKWVPDSVSKFDLNKKNQTQ
jgi:hypothetical protein